MISILWWGMYTKYRRSRGRQRGSGKIDKFNLADNQVSIVEIKSRDKGLSPYPGMESITGN
jgi:hypothetical protein